MTKLRPWLDLVARAIAFLFGAFAFLNAVVVLRHPAFDPNVWWIDLGFMPRSLGQLSIALAGVVLVSGALASPGSRGRRRAASVGLFLLAAVAMGNVVTFYVVWSNGSIHPAAPIPLSLLIAVALALAGAELFRPSARVRRAKALPLIAAVTAAFFVAVPAAQMAFFGTTDYRRHADAIVVFGAQVLNGRASSVLADRVDTSVQLYMQGFAPVIIMSGGIEPDGGDEAQVMKDRAIAQGVPASAILMDNGGFNTQASVDDTTAMFRANGFHTVLADSHFYHLARIKLAYAGEGYDVLTVPSRDTPVRENPTIISREIPAFWLYYLRAATG